MHIITRKRLNEFAEKHPDSKSSLQYWYRVMKSGRFYSFADLRATFSNADQIENLTIFNIGRQVRLVAAVHYNRQRVYIRAVLRHDEYDKDKWKE